MTPMRSDQNGDGERENLKKNNKTLKIITRVAIQLATSTRYSISLANDALQRK